MTRPRSQPVLAIGLILSLCAVPLVGAGRVAALDHRGLSDTAGAIDGSESTEVEHVQLGVVGDATSAARDVVVTGRAAFRAVPQVIATGPAGDAAIEGIGADLVAATVTGPTSRTLSFPAAPSDELVFSLQVADPPPAPTTGIPEVVTYAWVFDKVDGARKVFRLEASVSSQYHQPGRPDPVVVLVECPVEGTAAECPLLASRRLLTSRSTGS